MNYIGKICDGCREPLSDGDDIVVCPICGTPQHRSCYEKNHKCVNEYLHSTDFVWTDPDEEMRKAEEHLERREQDIVELYKLTDPPTLPNQFDPATPQAVESLFASDVLYDPKDDIGGATVGEAAEYIQRNAPKYISKFMNMKKKKRKLSWNWAAFFFAPYWFFYRKLYKAGMFFLALSVGLSLATVSRVEKVYDIYEEMNSVQREIVGLRISEDKDSDENLQKLESLYAKVNSLAKSAIPTIAGVFIIRKLIPNIIAAMIANFLLRKKMLKAIMLAHGSSDEPKIIAYTILRSGGVSPLMLMLAILVDSYLPTLLLNIANNLNF